MSHPSWVCGLKLLLCKQPLYGCCVTPFVGVWIETNHVANGVIQELVTPFVGVWIETNEVAKDDKAVMSHPSWVCGLKQLIDNIVVLVN